MGQTHTVEVPCSCDNVEQCDTELYMSDVRVLLGKLEDQQKLRQVVESVWGASMEVMRRRSA